ncbi:MAG: hypothetical protein KF718_14720 [Polyangiaceae bacterium]|nr:hypothetical protein [Polyangiaceae bacterium]
MSTKHLAAGLTLAFLVTLSSGAFAQGVVLAPAQLPAPARAALRAEITKARAAHPDAFAKVQQSRQLAIDLDRTRRGRAASITLPLRAIGKDALMPMLEMLALDGPKRGQMTDTAWLTLRVGLLEAVGETRDARARSVLVAVLERETQPEVVRAAAEALGRLLDDESAAQLVRLAKRGGPRLLPILAGMGECRRTVAVRELARHSTSRDPQVALIALQALGEAGNAWAWKTPAIAATGEEDAVRAIAATALLNAFVKNRGDVRERAALSLLLVDWSKTHQLITVAKRHAEPRTLSALGHLEQRLASNVTR